uniref:Diacylglycerol O-acyltransferase n=1 Tax=Pinguiococcus pyrenoidosus TaxID=172671 RepID=A0A7R9YCZ2_9STRA|mmetsp:Transcript_3631/g.14262  ORF Transcript_3631/g.14262 Transcript_3631/m.14262 type:complete len:543 (+) Transcript_3631:49-1677(+)
MATEAETEPTSAPLGKPADLVTEPVAEPTIMRARAMSFVGESLHILHMDYNEAPIIHAFVLLENQFDMESVKRTLQTIADTSPRFRSTIARDERRHLRRYNWIPCPEKESIPDQVLRYAHVGLDGSVRERDHPPQLDMSFERDARKAERHKAHFVGSMMKRPFRMGKPLWEVWVMAYEADPERHELIFRLSHSIGDGITLATVLLSVAESDGAAEPAPTPNPPRAGLLSLIWGGITAVYIHICAFLKVAALVMYRNDSRSAVRPPGIFDQSRQAARQCVELAEAAGQEGDSLLVPAQVTPSPYGFAEKTFPLERIKDICSAAGRRTGRKYTVNDVIQAAHYATVRRYLETHDPPQRSLLRKTTGLIVMNTRALGGLQQGGFSRDAPWGNEIGYIFLDYRLSGSTDAASALRLLEAARRDMAFFKRSPEPHFIVMVNRLLRRLVPTGTFLNINRFLVRKNSIILSNLRGPLLPLKFGGNPIVNVSNCVSPMMLSSAHSFFSYNGHLTYCVSAVAQVISDPNAFAELFEQEINLLHDAVSKVEE